MTSRFECDACLQAPVGSLLEKLLLARQFQLPCEL